MNVSYTVTCDSCGTDTGASRPNMREATEYAKAGGWEIQPDGEILCEICCEIAWDLEA